VPVRVPARVLVQARVLVPARVRVPVPELAQVQVRLPLRCRRRHPSPAAATTASPWSPYCSSRCGPWRLPPRATLVWQHYQAWHRLTTPLVPVLVLVLALVPVPAQVLVLAQALVQALAQQQRCHQSQVAPPIVLHVSPGCSSSTAPWWHPTPTSTRPPPATGGRRPL